MIGLRDKDLEELDDVIDQQIIVSNKYIIDKKIGKGSFGEVFKGHDKDTGEEVAIKIELSKTFHTKALIEGKILKKLQAFDGIPKLLFCGTEGDYNVLVLELLGPNLEDIMSYCDFKLSMKTVIMISDQLIQRMETIHNRGFIHRDIKSDNFLIGAGENINKIYTIDFGLSKRYVHPHTGEHILIKKHKGLIGTARFASINAHLGLEQSRRDDLQALGYLIIYLAKGSLPWQKIKTKNKQQKYRKIMDMKDSYTSEMLAEGLPEEFAAYLNYVKRLEFEERPDYAYLRKLFYGLLLKSDMQYDLKFDWMIPKEKRNNYRRKINRKFKTQQLTQLNNSIVENLENDQQEQVVEQAILNNVKDTSQKLVNSESSLQYKAETESSPLINKKVNNIPVQEENNHQLQVISEKNDDDQSPSQRQIIHLSPIKLTENQRYQSEIHTIPLKLINQTKSGLSLHQVVRQSKVKIRRRFTCKSLKKAKSKVKSAISEFFDLESEDFREEVDDNNMMVYVFENQQSKLDKEKALTPSPVKQRMMIGGVPKLDNFQRGVEESKRQSQKRFSQAGRSHDITLNSKPVMGGEQRRQNHDLEDSSMYTERDEQQDSQFNVRAPKLSQNQVMSSNTSSDEQYLIDGQSGQRTKKKNIINDENFDAQVIHDFIQKEKGYKQILRPLTSSQKNAQEMRNLASTVKLFNLNNTIQDSYSVDNDLNYDGDEEESQFTVSRQSKVQQQTCIVF